MADEGQIATPRGQSPSAEDAETPVAEHHHPLRAAQWDLLQDFAGRGQRLGEDRLLVAQRGRDLQQVRDRQETVFGHAAIETIDP